MGQGSIVSIVTFYRLDGLGFKNLVGQDSPYTSKLASRPTQPSEWWALDLYLRSKVSRAWL